MSARRYAVVCFSKTRPGTFEVLDACMLAPGKRIADGLTLEEANGVCRRYAYSLGLRALPMTAEEAAEGEMSDDGLRAALFTLFGPDDQRTS